MPNRTSSTNRPHTRRSPARRPPPAPRPSALGATSPLEQRRLLWRPSECWTRSVTARSRRRRPQGAQGPPALAAAHSSTPAPSPPTPQCSLFAQLAFPTSATAACVALLVLSTTCSLCAASPCKSHSWWDPVKDKCIPCTDCQGQSIVLRPCQLHRDTICGSIYDLEIDWMVLAKTEPNWKERRKSGDGDGDFQLQQQQQQQQQQFTHEELQQLQLQQQQQQHEESLPLDWQTAALFLAVLACLLFFIVAACILIQHMREWRRMERRLDQDVEELSTKLMAKLAEVQGLEGGTFFIGSADALKGPAAFQPQHVLLPEKHAKQHGERRIIKALPQPGNVYIEEGSCKG